VFHLHTPLPPPIHSTQPFLVTVHTSMAGEAGAIPVRDWRSLVVRLQLPVHIQTEHRLFVDAGQIAVVAQTVADELRGYGLDGKQVDVLGNGVDTHLFHPAEQSQSTQTSEPYLLAAGRLDVRKGLVDLVEAMSHVVERFSAAKLYIAGSGPLEGQLRAKIARLRLERSVRLLGHIRERAEMVQLYQDAAAFVHAAHYEGLPTVLLEAMACGKAIASTAISGILDAIEDGVNGLLVPPQRPEELAEAICCLLEDAGMRTRLGAAARRTVEERFSWQVVGDNYLHCYQALLDGVSR
jgi:glycosyltransferase involved in cell wall biosynthesis